MDRQKIAKALVDVAKELVAKDDYPLHPKASVVVDKNMLYIQCSSKLEPKYTQGPIELSFKKIQKYLEKELEPTFTITGVKSFRPVESNGVFKWRMGLAIENNASDILKTEITVVEYKDWR